MTKSLLLVLSLPIAFFAQSPTSVPKPDIWEPMKYFAGKWEGTGSGEPGRSMLEREYKFVLNNKFLKVDHRSTYAPQKKNPKGEIHEDTGMVSYDRARKLFVFRQFHIEGFVNQYVSAGISQDGKTIVFTSESIENIPAGYKARETYRILNADEFSETFEIAEPGKEYAVYSENKFKRKK